MVIARSIGVPGALGVPAGSVTMAAGVCKPVNASALAAFKALQTELNRVAAAKGWSRIAVDGDLGPKTVELFRKVIALHADAGTRAYWQAADCRLIAYSAEALTVVAKAIADGLGRPPATSAPVPSPSPRSPVTSPPPAVPPSDFWPAPPKPGFLDHVKRHKTWYAAGAILVTGLGVAAVLARR